jgi:3-hydroxymyristoyl/3-hydroxydecanoyl-(acyl carrier protein) dehydratase
MQLIDTIVDRDQVEEFLGVDVPLDLSKVGDTANAGKIAKRQELEEQIAVVNEQLEELADKVTTKRQALKELPPNESMPNVDGRQTKIKQELGPLDIYDLIPEREPGLQITRAVISKTGGGCLILAPFIITEEMCAGHMPGFPILPLAEAGRTLAQVGAILVAYTVKFIEGREGRFTPLVYKVGEIISGQQGFLVPGDKVCLVAQARKLRGPIYAVQAHGYLGDKHIFSMPKIHYFISQDQRLWGEV